MAKRLIRAGILVVAVLLLAACVTTTTTSTTSAATTTTTTESTTTTTTTTSSTEVTLPDLSGLNREEITEILENLGLTVKFYFDNSIIYTSEDQYDQFVKYGQSLVAGSVVAPGTEVRVYTSPLHLTVNYLYNLDESLQLEPEDYSGKHFIADGIGEVTVQQYVDGDTTWFSSSGEGSFSVRYLGIDTPESTALFEPWGKAASLYTKNVLSNAESIVLQAEGERQDGNGRYLAWVWYRTSADSKYLLLNLELVELAYSKNKVSVGSLFTSVLTLADWDASLTKRRVWGEIDPDFDYSKEGTQMTIQYLMENFQTYYGLKVCVTGTVTKKVGYSVYLEDENGYGVYVFCGYTPSAQLVVGANVTMAGMIPTYYSGCPQLSNFNKSNLYVNPSVTAPQAIALTYSQFDFSRIGTLVTISDLTVTGINAAGSTVTVRDADFHTFSVRIDDSTQLTAASLGITVGSRITVTGPLGYYDYGAEVTETYVFSPANFQLMLTAAEDLVILP